MCTRNHACKITSRPPDMCMQHAHVCIHAHTQTMRVHTCTWKRKHVYVNNRASTMYANIYVPRIKDACTQTSVSTIANVRTDVYRQTHACLRTITPMRHTPTHVRTRTCAVSPQKNVHTFAHAHVHTCTQHFVWRANARMYARASICAMQNNKLHMQFVHAHVRSHMHRRLRACMCAHVHVCTCTENKYASAWIPCLDVHRHVYAHIWICTPTHIHVSAFVRRDTCLHMRVGAHAYRCVRTYIHVYAYMRMCLLHKQMRARIKTGVYVRVRILWLITCTHSHVQRRCPCTPTSLWAHKHTRLYVLMHTNVCMSMETRFRGEASGREQKCMRVCAHVHVQHQQMCAYHATRKFMLMHTCSYVVADT